jgi:heat shock protein beta
LRAADLTILWPSQTFIVYVVFSATLRSGYMLKETADFAESVEIMMKKTLGIPLEEQVS